MFLKLVQRLNKENKMCYTEIHTVNNCMGPKFNFCPKQMIIILVLVIILTATIQGWKEALGDDGYVCYDTDSGDDFKGLCLSPNWLSCMY